MSEENTAMDSCVFCQSLDDVTHGICLKCRTERFQIYEIKPSQTNGAIDFSLSHVHREVIRFLGEHDGETFYEWSKIDRRDDESLRDDFRRYGEPFVDHVKRLVSMGFIRETPIIGQTRVLLRLTEWGHKVYQQIKNQLNLVGLNTPPPKA